MIELREADTEDADARTLLGELNAALERITGDTGASGFAASDVRDGRGVLLVATVDGQPMGCAALRLAEDGAGELKRVYARPNRLGVARRLIAALEERARGLGLHELRLETRYVNTHAMAFYQACGYRPIAAYGKYIGRAGSACYGKTL